MKWLYHIHWKKEVFGFDCPGSLLKYEFLKGRSTRWSFTQQVFNNIKLTRCETLQVFLIQPHPAECTSWNKQLQNHLLLLLLSRFSRVRLCVTSQTAAHQATPSLGFSRQEHWSGLPLPSPIQNHLGQHNQEKKLNILVMCLITINLSLL